MSELASGGMATVYLACRSGAGGFQRFFAIKQLHPHLSRDPEFVDMFLDEARLAARIRHPNVVPILEIEIGEDGYYLVMEYVEGDTLARLVAKSLHDQGRVPPNVAVRIILDALSGLHAAHELRDEQGRALEIVHRDVSPQNVLVGADGIAKLTDFGVARAAARLSVTRSGHLKGKLAYMAPEQARGRDAGPVDRRADIFAMGIVLWEVIAGKRLFRAESEGETLYRVLNHPVPTLSSVHAELPPALDAVCARALERDPDTRFATAMDFADALEKVADEAGMLGTHRDVAAQVHAVLGVELSQQRDAVRTWTSRSEPSFHDSAPPPHDPAPQYPSEPTRLEGARTVTPPRIRVPKAAVIDDTAGAGRARRTAVFALGAFALLALIVLGIVGLTRSPTRRAAASAPSASLGATASAAIVPATAASSLAAPSAMAVPAFVSSLPLASAAPAASVAPASTPSAARTGAAAPATTQRPTVRPTAPPKGPAIPDEDLKNPYR